MRRKEWKVKASNGLGEIYEVLYEDVNVEKKAIMLILHGMQSHSGRYQWMAEHFAKRGYVVALMDVQGHGRSANIPGYFGEKKGWDAIIEDVRREITLLKKWYPELPLVLFAHSMGSFIAREFVRRYPDQANGMILSGTAGMDPKYYPIKAAIRAEIAIHGKQHSGIEYGKRLCKYFNRHIPNSEGYTDWTCSLKEVRESRKDDALSMNFTIGAYYDMISGLINVSSIDWAKEVPDIHIYLFAGGADPVGEYGRGVAQVYLWLKSTGHDVQMRIYPKKRHECFNESNRAEVIENIEKWLFENLESRTETVLVEADE